jgi:long-chain acyl-CoA synthetase
MTIDGRSQPACARNWGRKAMLGNLGEISSHGARTYGDKVALVINGRSISFTEIDHLACQLANGLATKGVEPGDRVTLYAKNCWEWVVSYHGIAKTGAVVNPINMMLTPEEVGYVANDCQAKAIIASAARPSSATRP